MKAENEIENQKGDWKQFAGGCVRAQKLIWLPNHTVKYDQIKPDSSKKIKKTTQLRFCIRDVVCFVGRILLVVIDARTPLRYVGHEITGSDLIT